MRAVLCLLFLAMAISSYAAEDVSIPNIDNGRSLPLPGALHKPGGGGPFPAVVMLVGYGGYAGGGPNADHQSSWARIFRAAVPPKDQPTTAMFSRSTYGRVDR